RRAARRARERHARRARRGRRRQRALRRSAARRRQPREARGVAEGMSEVGAADVSAMVMSLLAVVGLIVAGGYLLRRTPLGAVARQSGPLKVVATLPLGARERLVLVEARGAELLLAISPAGVFSVARIAAGEGLRATG